MMMGSPPYNEVKLRKIETNIVNSKHVIIRAQLKWLFWKKVVNDKLEECKSKFENIELVKLSFVICHLRAELCVEVHVDVSDRDGLDLLLHHHPAPLSIVTDLLLRISLKTFWILMQ